MILIFNCNTVLLLSAVPELASVNHFDTSFCFSVTGDPAFSMFNLSLKDDWYNNSKFCHRLTDEEDLMGIELAAREAQDRLDAHRSRQGSPETSSGDDSSEDPSETSLNDSNGNPSILKNRTTDIIPLLNSSLTHKKSVSPQL